METSIIIPLYKNKGDIQDRNNYKGIKLLSHTMKLRERGSKRRLIKDILISENQFGFMLGISTTEAIHLKRRLMKLCSDKKNLHMIIDLKKAYDRVLRKVLWECLDKKEVLMVYIPAINYMYEGVKISVRISAGDTENFPIGIKLHQGLALSPLLFNIVLD